MKHLEISGLKYKLIAITIISLLIGYAIGYYHGAKTMVNWGVDKAVYFMKIQGINITVDEEMISEGIWRYKNSIGGCWDIENGSSVRNL